jgi:protein-glutamine gamma-glutamyltransferase
LKVNTAPLIWDPADDSLSAPPHPFRRLAYQAESLCHDAYASQPLSVLPDDDRRRYLQLPSLDPRVAALAKEISSSATGERSLADKTEKFLRDNYRYSLEEAPILNPQPLESFLFETRKGHCEYFATAMVVLLRNLEVPSRIVNGFRGGDYNGIAGDLVVRARMAHSWVEVFIPGSGWSSFDPTPAAIEGPQQIRLLKTLNNCLDALDLFWGEWILGYDSLVQISLLRGMEDRAGNWARFGQNIIYWTTWQLGEKLFRLTVDTWKAIRFVRISWIILLLLLCVALIGCMVWFVKRNGQDEATEPNRQMATAIQLYTALLCSLKGLGRTKSEYLTPNEFAATFARDAIARQVEEITTIYNLLRFSLEPPRHEQLKHAYQLLDEIKAYKRTMGMSR